MFKIFNTGTGSVAIRSIPPPGILYLGETIVGLEKSPDGTSTVTRTSGVCGKANLIMVPVFVIHLINNGASLCNTFNNNTLPYKLLV